MTISLTFCGAAGGVTGSCYLVQHAQGAFLVDCGLFQGSKTVQQLNWGAFPFPVDMPKAMVLTHAHIDHSGLIPKLWKQGYERPIYATQQTIDLLTFMLPDSGYIQETETRRLNLRNVKRGRKKELPAYTRDDAEACLELMRPVAYNSWTKVMKGVRARYWNAGHMLGSASIEIEVDNPGSDPVRILFSGDIGPGEKVFHDEPQAPSDVDFLVCESTYGDREREDVHEDQRRTMLAALVNEAHGRGGNIVIPTFAVERTQELLTDFAFLFDQKMVPPRAVFLDSPLAIRATEVFEKHLAMAGGGGDRPFHRDYLHFTLDQEASKRLNDIEAGAIILAASGMCDAGRIRHHLKNNLWRDNATVLFVGYQAPGTLGRTLLDGVKQVRIHGEEIEIRAQIRALDVYSGHADQSELVDWIQARLPVRGGIFLTHGEDGARATLRKLLEEKGITCPIIAPVLDQKFELAEGLKPRSADGKARLPAMPKSDWHNAYAETVLELSRTLQALPDAGDRQALLDRVRAAIEPPG